MEQPSVELRAFLEGRREISSVCPAVRSWAQFFIYQAAKEIIAMPDRQQRREALDKIPETIRDKVRDEATRLWRMR